MISDPFTLDAPPVEVEPRILTCLTCGETLKPGGGHSVIACNRALKARLDAANRELMDFQIKGEYEMGREYAEATYQKGLEELEAAVQHYAEPTHWYAEDLDGMKATYLCGNGPDVAQEALGRMK